MGVGGTVLVLVLNRFVSMNPIVVPLFTDSDLKILVHLTHLFYFVAWMNLSSLTMIILYSCLIVT